jgi:prepilin-type N-terminal cleavage/methylation domain-containing protein
MVKRTALPVAKVAAVHTGGKFMFQRVREARQNESGFTLIELLIVIVILGVLAGIVVFAVQAFNNDGKVSACKADKKNVEIATEAFYAKSNPSAYPAGATSADRINALVTASYLKEAPGTTNYTISLASDGTVTSNLAGC